MKRLADYAFCPVIEEAERIARPAINKFLNSPPDYFCGEDPVFAGLHSFDVAKDGRSYRQAAHCAYPWHTIDKSTTVVLPMVPTVNVVVHEIGHAIHEAVDFDFELAPVDDYAARNKYEAFAMAFASYAGLYGESYYEKLMSNEYSRHVMRFIFK